MRKIIIGYAIFFALLGLGLWVQARWDKECGPGNRWNPDEWRCVPQEYNG